MCCADCEADYITPPLDRRNGLAVEVEQRNALIEDLEKKMREARENLNSRRRALS